MLPLERVIGCVQDTLVEISHLEDVESSILRQKYLLHFLYKYISRSVRLYQLHNCACTGQSGCTSYVRSIVGSPSTANLGEDIPYCLLRKTYPNSAKGTATLLPIASMYVIQAAPCV